MKFDDLSVPKPCAVSWDTMTPIDGQPARNCAECDRSIYNFEDMSREEIAALWSTTQEICARLPKHPDGTLVTRDAPRRGLQVLTAGAAALALAACNNREISRGPIGEIAPPTATHAVPIGTVTLHPVTPPASTIDAGPEALPEKVGKVVAPAK